MEPYSPVLFLLGASHPCTAPLAVREKLALDDARAATLAARLQQTPGVREFTLLNTCNRVEIYGVARNEETLGAHCAWLCAKPPAASLPADLNRAGFLRQNHDTVAHLFSVASGIDSQIVGGDANPRPGEGSLRWRTGPPVDRARAQSRFPKTFQAAKYIRTHTAVGAGQISIATCRRGSRRSYFRRFDRHEGTGRRGQGILD